MKNEFFAKFGDVTPSWLGEDGPASDIAICSRARLSRNLAGVPFPDHAAPEARKTVRADLNRRLQRLPTLASGGSFNLEELDDTQRRSLCEKMLMPHRLLADG